MFHEIIAQKGELDKCVNCGLCQSVCPTYLANGYEGLTARGKIILMREFLSGSLKPNSDIADLFDDCLTCYACQTVCPAGVQTEKLWTAARQDFKKQSSLKSKLKQFGIRWTIGKPKLFLSEIKLAGRIFGRTNLDSDTHSDSKFRLPIRQNSPYISQLYNEYPAVSEEIGSVALLIGCSCNISAHGVIDGTINLLTHAGYRVVIPKEQVCCGAPAVNNSEWKTARKLALMNIETFLNCDTDFILSPDATCANTLKYEYFTILKEEPETVQDDLKLFSNKVKEFSNFIMVACKDSQLKFKNNSIAVTIHDSCHATHVGQKNQWRDILGYINGLKILEMDSAAHCCGFGGSYAFLHGETSRKIAKNKLLNASESGANILLVSSPGCKMHLQITAQKLKLKCPAIRHTTEFLCENLIENK